MKWLILLAATWVAGCTTDTAAPSAPAPGTLLADPTAPLPATIAELGLYPNAPDLSVQPTTTLAYVPRWPLWSNGLAKQRVAVFPTEITVEAAADAGFEVPVGALFFKTFSVEDPAHPGGQRPIETRVIRVLETRAEYGAYLWNADGTDGEVLTLREPVEVAVPGGTHQVPNIVQCRTCHESNPEDAPHAILGWTHDQLGPAEAGVTHADPLTEEVLGWFAGNCVHCHNGSGGPSSSFDLRWRVAEEHTIGQPTQGIASAAGIRVIPGDPDQSVLYRALVAEDGANNTVVPMPPAGVQIKDAAAIARVRQWIEALPQETP